MPRLKENIPVLLGLACGQQRGKGFAEYLVRRAGQGMDSVRRISFREKREGQPATKSHFAVWTERSAFPYRVERSDGYGLAWSRSYFKQDACNYCDDVFAEVADAAFMDAWLPGFREDPRGTSIVIARSRLCADLLSDGARSGALSIVPIDIRDVIRSQQGCLHVKRDGAALQLSLNENRPLEFHPRVQPAPSWRLIARYRKAAENRGMAASRKALAAQRNAGPGLKVFIARMKQLTRNDTPFVQALRLLSLANRVLRQPVREWANLAARFRRRKPREA